MKNNIELPPTRVHNTGNLVSKLTLAGLAVGFSVSSGGSDDIRKFSPGSPVGTHISRTEISPFFQEPISSKISSEEKQAIADSRRKIAHEFGIELQTLDEVSTAAVAARLLNGPEGWLFSYQDWNEQSLNLLENVLKNLPKKFYEPDENGEKVHIILGSSTHCGSGIKEFMPFYPRAIMLSSMYFRPEIPLSAAWVLTHEFGHLKTTDSCKQTDPTYFARIDEILGADFDQLKQDLSDGIQTQAEQSNLNIEKSGMVSPIESIKTPETEEVVRLTRLKYGISNEKEFIAVIAESYFLGRDYFQRMYGPFFPQDAVDNLYEFARDDIFDGEEYPDYQTTAVKLKN